MHSPAVMRDKVNESRIFTGCSFIRFRVEKMDGFQFSDISYLAMRKTLDPF